MSWRIANECADRRFGSAARKQIIMFLADKASDDGSGIWCSKGTIQRHTELGESTVKRTISDFLKEGILIETGRRPCKNGFTVIYRIVLARVMALESSAEPDDGTGVTVDPVQPEPGTGSTVDGVRGPRWTPNHPKTIHKPPTHERAKAAVFEDERFEKIWAAYPKDRQRGKAACLARIAEAVKEGVDPDDLLRAVPCAVSRVPCIASYASCCAHRVSRLASPAPRPAQQTHRNGLQAPDPPPLTLGGGGLEEVGKK